MNLLDDYSIFSRLIKHEFALTEQGSPIGLMMLVGNNLFLTYIFYHIFQNSLLSEIANSWLYLLLGIIQWNLYSNAAFYGLGCFIYRRSITLGFPIPNIIMLMARTSVVFITYIIELIIVLMIATMLSIKINISIFQLIILIPLQFMLCLGLNCFLSILGSWHKNIMSFWNTIFKILAFATPVFYLPIQFKNKSFQNIYDLNPYSRLMVHIRHSFSPEDFTSHYNLFTSACIVLFLSISGYLFFKRYENKIGDLL
jgi:ABC-type polysaccharide/polyol phosphate export permease